MPTSVERLQGENSYTPEDLLNSRPTLRLIHTYGDQPRYMAPAAAQLIEFGATQDLLSDLFDNNFSFAYEDRKQAPFLSMPADNAYSYTEYVLEPVYEAIGLFLDEPTSSRRPYNDHGKEHVRFVKNKSVEIYREYLRNGGTPQFGSQGIDELVLSVASSIHDIGYFLHPDNHPEASMVLANKIFPQLSSQLNPENKDIIEKVDFLVRYHEGDAFRTLVNGKGIRTHSQLVAYLESEPLLSAFCLADKLHQNSQRIRGGEILDKKPNASKFTGDSHIEVNLLTPITRAGIVSNINSSEDVKAYDIRYTFDQSGRDLPNRDELSKFLVASDNEFGSKLGVSEDTKRKYKEEDQEYFYTLIDRNLEIYATKMVRMSIFALSLFPDINQVNFEFVDVDRERYKRYIISRNNLEASVNNFWDKTPYDRSVTRHRSQLKI